MLNREFRGRRFHWSCLYTASVVLVQVHSAGLESVNLGVTVNEAAAADKRAH